VNTKKTRDFGMHQPIRFVGEQGLGGGWEKGAWLLVDVIIRKELILTVILKDAWEGLGTITN
jgi:hypothetical protein